MDTFLGKVANYLHSRYGEEAGRLCIVLPNRRAGLFLREYWTTHLQRASWSPSIYAGEDFVAELSGLQLIDNFEQLFTLYAVYRKHKGKKAEPFESFSRWAPALLADFSEADGWLADTQRLFGNVGSLKNMESWGVQNDRLTEFQQRYLGFWESLGVYYTQFRERLLAERKAYPGLAYRMAAEDILQNSATRPWTKIVFAGFNALNAAEEKMIGELCAEGRAEILWDCDSYYMNDEAQEAGRFLRRYRDRFPNDAEKHFEHEENLLSTSEKHIVLLGTARRTAQAQAAAHFVEGWLNEAQSIPKRTAVVTGDEQLLLPLLHALPENAGEVNVTMGYPMRNTPIAALAALLLDLHDNARRLNMRTPENETRFHHTDLARLFQHPYFRLLFSKSKYSDKLLQHLAEHNQVFISAGQMRKALPEMEKDFKRIAPLFRTWETARNAFDSLYHLTAVLRKLFGGKGGSGKANVELEFLFQFDKIVRRLRTLSEQYPHLRELRTLRTLLLQAVDNASLPFYGEPLTGLQVMGLLETRALDFENLILLSANENILPPGRNRNSFIVGSLRKAFNLPSWDDKDAVTAYHFYRLLQRAKRIVLIYNTESDTFGSGERSRYLTQLLYEMPRVNPNVKIEERLFSAPGIAPELKAVTVEKTPEVQARLKELAESGLSPSLLNSFRTCGLQFYYHYVARLRENERVEEHIGADTMGTVIHAVLEHLYQPFIGSPVTCTDIDHMIAQAPGLAKNEFAQRYPPEELSYGKNLLTQHMTLKFLNDFLEQEKILCEALSERGQEYRIRELESQLGLKLLLGEQAVELKGHADRIDEAAGVLRLVDYKTGRVEDSELRVGDWFSFNSDVNLNKSFQLLMYALMYVRSGKPAGKLLKSGIISFRELKAGLKTVKTPFGGDLIGKNELDAFEERLRELLAELFDPAKPFTQSDDLQRCEICAYKAVCNRG